MRTQTNSGFTLLEVMVVMVIIGILAALIVPNVMGRVDESKITAARTNIAGLVQALKMYRLDNGRYPTTEQGLQALVQKPSVDPIPRNWKNHGYIDSLPKDPWGNDFKYLHPGVRGEIDVYTLGADGVPGGEEMDADIGNWAAPPAQ